MISSILLDHQRLQKSFAKRLLAMLKSGSGQPTIPYEVRECNPLTDFISAFACSRGHHFHISAVSLLKMIQHSISPLSLARAVFLAPSRYLCVYTNSYTCMCIYHFNMFSAHHRREIWGYFSGSRSL